MAYRFVSLERGERNIHWFKLGAFAALTFVVVPAIVGLAWYGISGYWGNEALMVGGFLSTLIVIRSILRAYSVPERELNSDEPSGPSISEEPGVTPNLDAPRPTKPVSAAF